LELTSETKVEGRSMKLSIPEMIALLLYAPGQTGKIGEEIRGKTKLMKLVFLLAKEEDLEKTLTEPTVFQPYKYGPFDARIYDAVEALKELGIVEEKAPPRINRLLDEDVDEAYDVDTVFRLTPKGISRVENLVKDVPHDIFRRISNIKTIHGSKPLVELLHYVYQRYPSFAVLSEANI